MSKKCKCFQTLLVNYKLKHLALYGSLDIHSWALSFVDLVKITVSRICKNWVSDLSIKNMLLEIVFQ